MQNEPEKSLDLVWGVAAISKVIGRSRPQTLSLLAQGSLPGKLVGNRWVVSRAALVKFFEEIAA